MSYFMLDSEIADSGCMYEDECIDCPDCDTQTDLVDSGYDDFGNQYKVYTCPDGCGDFSEDGEYIFSGQSDYAERMWERRQMGLCRF